MRKTQLNMRINPELGEMLHEIASKNNITITAITEEAIKAYIEEHKNHVLGIVKKEVVVIRDDDAEKSPLIDKPNKPQSNIGFIAPSPTIRRAQGVGTSGLHSVKAVIQ